MACNIQGILSIGNTKPESSIVGIINAINETIIAVCCVSVLVEIKMPKESEVKTNNTHIPINNARLPTIGISNTKTLTNKMITALIKRKQNIRRDFPNDNEHRRQRRNQQ